MIDFEQELKKFHLSLEVEQAEKSIQDRDVTDMIDMMLSMTGNKPAEKE